MRQFRQTGPFGAIALREPTPGDVQLFLNLSQDLRCVLDIHGNFVYLSPNWATALDVAADDLMLQPLLYWVHPDDREATLRGLVEAVESKKLTTFEHRLAIGDARPRSRCWSVQLEASSRHLVGVAVDVTDTRAEIELYRKAVEASPTAVIMTDQDGQVVLVNRQAEALFGYDRAEILGQPVDTLIPVPLRTRHQRLRGNFLSAPDQRMMGAGRELFGVRKDGSAVQIEVTLCPMATAAGMHVLCSVVDITERKRHDA
ncbi:MAG: PAS domain S-box protein, partial [Deltaproteobacteria bacterium]|nr:PAS domain S-box protein [Deltaproteobacteria bacterium]